MENVLEKLARKIGYQFKDLSLLEQALTHRSLEKKHNERLEFLGDSVVNFIVADILFHKKSKAQEGDLSRIRASLVNRDGLADIAKEFGLSDYLRMGAGELRSGGYLRASILSDCLEAIIGAMYIDSDMTTCEKVIGQWFMKRIDNISDADDLKDPKTRLQEHLQARKLELPKYKLVKTTGKHHQQTFFIECHVAGLNITETGNARTRRKAEQAAAQACLLKIEKSHD